MFEDIDIVQMLSDLLCVKLPKQIRQYLFFIKNNIGNDGFIEYKDQDRIRDISIRYRKNLKELYAARERAKITNGLRSMGMSRSEFKSRVSDRIENEKMNKLDVGF